MTGGTLGGRSICLLLFMAIFTQLVANIFPLTEFLVGKVSIMAGIAFCDLA